MDLEPELDMNLNETCKFQHKTSLVVIIQFHIADFTLYYTLRGQITQ